jgi:hypothetical protein
MVYNQPDTQGREHNADILQSLAIPSTQLCTAPREGAQKSAARKFTRGLRVGSIHPPNTESAAVLKFAARVLVFD